VYSVNPDPNNPLPPNSIIAPFPMPFNQIEFSPSPFTLVVIAKDSVGNVFQLPISQTICRPAGNVGSSPNTFGLGMVNITPDCNKGYYFFEDFTNVSYQGNAGVLQSSTLKVVYPEDMTGSQPAPIIFNGFATALAPVTFDSENYQFIYNSIFKYDFPNGSSVLVRYYLNSRFVVNCGIDLCPLVCEYVKLLQASISKPYDTELQKLLVQINGKMNLAMLAKMQPSCGIDLGALIEEIKTLGGFECDCCSPSGIRPFNNSLIDNYNFNIVSGGGDITGSVSQNGTNITFTLSDKSYIFKICDDAPTQALTVTPSVAGATKTFCLNVDMNMFALDILNVIQGSQSLVNLFNAIVTVGSTNFSLIVDGGKIFQSTAACNYDYNLQGIPTTGTYAIVTTMNVNNVVKTLNYSFNTTNLTDLQNYINSLGFGVFTLSTSGTGVVDIISTNNPNNLSDLTYRTINGSFIAKFTKTCTGFIPKPANEVVQDIINYLSGITDAQVITSQAYDICYIDKVTGLAATVTINAGTDLNIFLAAFLDKQCTNVNYILSLSAVTCASVVKMFPQNVNILQATDIILGTKEGTCARMYPVELGQAILELGANDKNFMTTFCTLVQMCQGNSLCDPYTVYNVNVTRHSPSDNKMDISIQFVHPAAISSTLEYARVDNVANPVYTTVPNVLPSASPYTIPNLDLGQYIVRMTPKYSDGRTCFPTARTTDPCFVITAFNAGFSSDNLHILVNYSATSAFVKVHVTFPSGGVYENIVTNDGVQISVPNPTGEVGNYTVYMIPYCNQVTNWYGTQTAPAIISITGSVNCAAPTNLTRSFVTATSFSEAWTAVAGATSYQYSINGGGWIGLGNSLNVTVSGLNAGSTYYFEVGAVIGSVTCPQLASDTVTTTAGAVCAAPSSLVASNTTPTSFTETWSAVAGADSYQYRINGGAWTNVGSNLSVNITGLNPSTSYSFDVGAIVSGTTCPQLASNSVTTGAGAVCAAPTNLVASNITYKSFTETWTAVPGASSYQYRTNGGAWQALGNVTTVNLTGLSSSTSYSFDVGAIVGGTVCTQLASNSVTTTAAPSLVQISNTDTGVGGTRTQVAQIDINVPIGATYLVEVYSHRVSYVVVSGDTPNSVLSSLVALINATTETQWNSSGAAPTHGTNGFPPTATVSSSRNITVVLNYQNQTSFSAY